MTKGRIDELLAQVPTAERATELEPVQGLAHAVHWSTGGGRYNRSAIVTPGGRHLLEFSSRERYDSALSVAVLRHSIEHWQSLIGTEAPIRLAWGFEPPEPFRFDVVLALPPGLHRAHQVKLPALHEQTFMVFPGFSSEIVPQLTESEAIATKGLVPFSDIERPENPVLRTRFKTHVRTLGKERALTTERRIIVQIHNLEKCPPGGFVEIENAAGQLARFTREGVLQVDVEGSSLEFDSADGAVSWLRSFSRTPTTGPCTRPGNAPGVSGVALPPLTTLTCEDGTVADGLSDWQLEQELERIGPHAGNRFAVLRRGDQYYIQCYAREDGLYDVEFRDGGSDEHYRSLRGVDLGELQRLFVLYGVGDDSWRSTLEWENVRLG